MAAEGRVQVRILRRDLCGLKVGRHLPRRQRRAARRHGGWRGHSCALPAAPLAAAAAAGTGAWAAEPAAAWAAGGQLRCFAGCILLRAIARNGERYTSCSCALLHNKAKLKHHDMIVVSACCSIPCGAGCPADCWTA